jgi:hypothetical protein
VVAGGDGDGHFIPLLFVLHPHYTVWRLNVNRVVKELFGLTRA